MYKRQAQALYERIEVYSSQLGIDTYRNFYLFDRQGNYLTGSNEELGRTLQMTPNLLKALGGERGNEQGIAERYMDYAVALDDYVIYIKDSKDEVRDLTWEMVLLIIETMFVTMVIAILLSFLLARTITNPIERLTEGALRVAGGDFEPITVCLLYTSAATTSRRERLWCPPRPRRSLSALSRWSAPP